MADRSVVVRLRAEITQYQAGMAKAKATTHEFGKEVSLQGKSSRADIERLGHSALLMGGAMALGFGRAIQVGMGFEKQMSGVKAVSGATAAEMNRLSEAALAAGSSQMLAGVTASDAAKAEAELVKAGVSVTDVLGGALMGSLTLASAGQIDFANAATIAAQAMNIFDLSGRDVTHIADLLAAASNKSATDVGALGDAMRQGGLVAAQTGLSIEETVGALAAFGDNALIGSDAGTSLKTMLQRLTPISKEAAGLMEDIGFSAYDATGQFIGLSGLAGELQTSMAGMTDEQRNLTLAQLFGSDAVRGANVLYEEGSAGMRDYVDAVNDQGAAARMAAIQNDNLTGDIEALGGAFETALIKNGSQANGVLRFMAKTATGVVTGFSEMPSVVQGGTMAFGALATTGTLALGAIGTLAPKVVEAKKALDGMGASGEFLSRNLKNIGGAMAGIGAGIAVFSAWEGMLASARSEAEKWSATWQSDAFSSSTDGLDAYRQKLSDVNFEWAIMSDKATSSKSPFDADKRAQLQAGADALDAIGSEMGRVTDLSDDLAASLGISGDNALKFVLDQQAAGVDVLASDYGKVKSALEGTFGSMTTGTVASQQLKGGLETLGSEIATVEEKADALSEAIEAIFAELDTRASIDQFNTGLNDMAEHFADADAAVGEATDRLDGARGSLDDLLSIPVADRGESWARQVETARDAVVDAEAQIAEAIEGTSRSLEGNSQVAIDNRDRLDQLARDGAAAIEDMAADQTMSIDEIMWIRGEMIGQMEAEATRLGLNKDEVGFYTQALKDIPVGVSTSVRLDTDEAMTAAELLRKQFSTWFDEKTYDMKIRMGGEKSGESVILPSVGGLVGQGVLYRAAGGWAPRGTDTVPAMLTPGEFVVNAQATSRFGVGNLSRINAGQMSPVSGGSSSTDNSRHVRFDAPISVAAPSPVDAAGQVQFRLRRLALQAGV